MARPEQPPERRQAWAPEQPPLGARRAASGASGSPGRSASLGQSPGPPLPVPVGLAALAPGESAWGPRPLLWSAAARFRSLSNERPKQERDSLRNRSVEGRAGSRKNKRWARREGEQNPRSQDAPLTSEVDGPPALPSK
ncbi:unnamed protein product [Prorocentrum cordatum]|uniref:Uncharacterized protein n=1 Tax=Prorocentrum cordatum TaxID=2364126 RepID=A0ABN9T6R6_9DINO|nr:unnamed protein product [Polarella glacialis]